MRRFVEICLVFFLGWILSWSYFGYRDVSRESVVANNLGSPKVSEKTIDKQDSLARADVTEHLPGVDRIPPVDHLRANELLKNGQFAEFVQMFTGPGAKFDAATTSRFRKLLFNKLYDLKKENKLDPALELLKRYLEYEYDDVDALSLLSTLYGAQGKTLAAIDILYKAKSYAHRNEKIEALTGSIRDFTTDYQLRLKKQSDDLGLLALYTRLTELEPEYAPHYIGLAEVYIALGDNDDASSALAMASHDPSVSGRVNSLIEVINNTPPLDLSQAQGIPMIRVRDQFLIEVQFNDRENVNLLLDTGASLSIITSDVLSSLGIGVSDASKTGWFNTANGVVEANIYTLKTMSVGDYRVTDIDVAVMEISSNDNIQGLLGMNFLKHFEFFIDQGGNVLFLQ